MLDPAPDEGPGGVDIIAYESTGAIGRRIMRLRGGGMRVSKSLAGLSEKDELTLDELGVCRMSWQTKKYIFFGCLTRNCFVPGREIQAPWSSFS